MTIAVGERLPQATFGVMTDDGPANVTSDEFFSGKKVVLFSVPGAYTPTCHAQHLPGFLAHADQLKAKGVDVIACTAVNDVFVLSQWGKDSGAEGKVAFLADGNGEFVKSLGLELDLTGVGLGLRGHRFAMLVDDGVVTIFNLETVPSSADESSAEALLAGM